MPKEEIEFDFSDDDETDPHSRLQAVSIKIEPIDTDSDDVSSTFNTIFFMSLLQLIII